MLLIHAEANFSSAWIFQHSNVNFFLAKQKNCQTEMAGYDVGERRASAFEIFMSWRCLAQCQAMPDPFNLKAWLANTDIIGRTCAFYNLNFWWAPFESENVVIVSSIHSHIVY